MLAERLPTQENGDWVINPDGTMVATYHLRSVTGMPFVVPYARQ